MALTAASLVVSWTSQGAKDVQRDIADTGGAVDKVSRNTGLTRWVTDNDQHLSTLGKSFLGTGSAILAGFGVPLTIGTKAAWGQVDAVEKATTALRAYESDTDKVNRVLAELIDYARSDLGVLFQRQDLFAAAQGLKVMGAETDDLTRYVEIMSRSVGIGTGTWDELNRVIGRVGSTGKLTGYDFDMLTKMGYRLDPALRNTTITWNELFAALDKGIPANALTGQVDMIQGKSIRLQSALRSLGMAFLGVDANTSQFVKGGLGDALVRGMGQGRSLALALVPAVEQLGFAMGRAATWASGLVDRFLQLPQPIQTVVFALTALAGAGMAGLGTLLLFAPRIVAFGQALAALPGILGAIGTTLGALALPMALAASAIVAFGLAYRTNFLGFGDAVRSVAGWVSGVFATIVQKVREVIVAFQAFRQVTDPVTAALKALQIVFPGVAAAITPVIAGLTAVGTYIRHVLVDGNVLNDWLMHLPVPIQGVTLAIGAIVAGLRSVALAIREWIASGQAVAGLSAAFSAMWSIVQPILVGIVDIAKQAGLALLSAFDGFIASGLPQRIGAALRGLWESVRNLWTALGPLQPLVLALAAAFLMVISPIGLVGTALIALGAAFVTAYQKSETFRSIVTAVFQALGTIVGMIASALGVALVGAIHLVTAAFNTAASVISVISGVFSGIGAVVQAVISWFSSLSAIVGAAGGAWQSLGSIVGTVMSGIGSAVSSGWEVVQRMTSSVAGVITGVVSGAWYGLAGIVGAAMSGVSAAVSVGWTLIQAMVSGAMGVVQSVVSDGWTLVQGIVTGAMGVILSIVMSGGSALAGSVSSVMGTISGVVASGWSVITGVVSGAMSAVRGAVSGGMRVIQDVMSAAWATITSTVSAAAAAVVVAITSGWSTLTGFVAGVMSGIQGTVSAGWTAVQHIVSGAVSIVQSVVTAAWNAINSVVSSVTSAMVGVVTSLWSGLSITISNIVSGIQATVTSIWSAIQATVTHIVSSLVSSVTSLFNTLLSSVSSLLDRLLSSARSTFSDLRSTTTSIVSGMVSSLIGLFSDLLGDAIAKVTSIKNEIASGFTTAKTEAVAAVRTLASDVIGVLSGLVTTAASKALEIGGAIIGGIKDSIAGGVGDVTSAISGVVGDAIGGAKGLLGIGSPSRVFMSIGEDTMRGMVIGLLRGGRNVEDVLAALNRDLIGASAARLTGDATAPTVKGAGPQFAGRVGSTQVPEGGLYIENLTLDLRSVQELVEAAAFVRDMSRARSLVRGARVRS